MVATNDEIERLILSSPDIQHEFFQDFWLAC